MLIYLIINLILGLGLPIKFQLKGYKLYKKKRFNDRELLKILTFKPGIDMC